MRILKVVVLPLFLGLAACSAGFDQNTRPYATQDQVAALEAGILALGPNVDPGEARRAAQIAYDYTRQLAIDYQITDAPLVHNTKVNLGWKPRGLCWHWAEDLQNRLNAEGFETLEMHRAIANADNDWLIDHSTAIISAKGDTFDQGVVLDPWRQGGVLFWSPLADDTRYDWVERSVVMKARRAELLAKYGDAVL